MRFDEGRSIFQQIVEYVQDGILQGHWQEEDRIPSVRELAIEVGVNPNTVQRSYSALQDEGLIYNQRGVGYFVAPEARQYSRELRRAHFEGEILPRVFETMEAIDYSLNDLAEAQQLWKERQK